MARTSYCLKESNSTCLIIAEGKIGLLKKEAPPVAGALKALF